MKKNQSLIIGGLAAFAGVTFLSWLASATDQTLLIAPFGATFVLIIALPESPLGRPRNIIGGYVISAFIGLSVLTVFGTAHWVTGLGVALAIVAMQLTKTIHPPAGAVPLLVLATQPAWTFMLTPIAISTVLLAGFAVAYKYERRAEHVQN